MADAGNGFKIWRSQSAFASNSPFDPVDPGPTSPSISLDVSSCPSQGQITVGEQTRHTAFNGHRTGLFSRIALEPGDARSRAADIRTVVSGTHRCLASLNHRPPVPSPRISSHRSNYHERVLFALVIVLGSSVGLVHLWPAPGPAGNTNAPFSDRPDETIQIETVQPTRQTQELRPPPPAPLPPVVVPNDRIVESDFEWSDGPLPIENPGEDARRQEGRSGPPTALRMPETSARLLRAVQPTYPEKARQADVRARVEVSVQINVQGKVTDAVIIGRWRLDKEGRATPTASLGYGLEAAALTAAHRSRFRPARNRGEPVATETTITFTFGD